MMINIVSFIYIYIYKRFESRFALYKYLFEYLKIFLKHQQYYEIKNFKNFFFLKVKIFKTLGYSHYRFGFWQDNMQQVVVAPCLGGGEFGVSWVAWDLAGV